MAQYHDITQQEIEDLLLPQGFKPMSLPDTVELVYGRRIDKDGHALSLRVYTGINPSGHSRDVGTDAIRLVLFCRYGDKVSKIDMLKRVHRVKGWRKNLQSRINDWKTYDLHTCNKCGKLMAVRKSKGSKFYGCVGYPDCKSTKPYGEKK